MTLVLKESLRWKEGHAVVLSGIHLDNILRLSHWTNRSQVVMALMHKSLGLHGAMGVDSLTALNIFSNGVHLFSPFVLPQ